MAYNAIGSGSTQVDMGGSAEDILAALLEQVNLGQNTGRAGGPGIPQVNTGGSGSFDWLGTLGTAADIGTGLFNAFNGYQIAKTGKDRLKFDKKAFTYNANAQAQSLNTQLEDRQRARSAADTTGAGNYQSLSDYMSKNAIKSYG